MFPRKFKICDAFGIPVYLDFSFIILLLLFVTDFGSFSLGLSFACVLALSITLHELGHALTARCFGYNAREITLSLLGGCAQFINMPRKAWQEFLTAAAGPAVSFAISGISFLLLWLVPIESRFIALLLTYCLWMNLILGGFNLLPGFPMDGGRIFRSVARIFTTRAKATYAAMVVGRVFAVLLGLRGLWSIANHGGWGFISILIAWMIWREGWREYQQARAEEMYFDSASFARVSPPPYSDDDDDEVEIRRR